MPVDRVTIHHRGGGAPQNGAWSGSDPYSILIGVTQNTIQQSPLTSWATAGFNHVSYDVCLSGNRMVWAVTDSDLQLLRDAYEVGVARGWIVPSPTVYPHGTLYPPPAPYPSGSSPTECPGTLTIARWLEIISMFQAAVPGSSGGNDMPADKDFVDAYANSVGAWKLQYDGGITTVRGPFYGSYFSLSDSVRNDLTRRFLTLCAPVDGSAVGYSLVSIKGEVYTFKTAQ
jgi:N-acetylmuramoyl-L-alanine amidase